MPSLESEIRKHTGVSFRDIPADGKYRSFKHQGKEWFALSFGDCGSFGSLILGEVYGWSGGKAWPILLAKKTPKPSRRQLEEDHKVVAVGNLMQDQGQTMPESDLDRYIEALTRVIHSNAKNI